MRKGFSNVWRNIRVDVPDEACPDCEHDEHEAGKCENCNCGSSDIIHSQGQEFLVPSGDARNVKASGGRRAYRSGTE